MIGSTDSIRVRYWAAARAAAGTAEDELAVDGALSLAEVRERVLALHPGTRLAPVLAVCSVLLGETPAGTRDPTSILVPPGTTVEFLPPFAGG